MNYLKIFVREHQNCETNEANPFSHSWEEQTREISKANDWLNEGSSVSAVYSVNRIYSEVIEVCEIKLLDNGNVHIIDVNGYEYEMPWDDQKRTIIPRYFWIDGLRTFSFSRAKKAVQEGNHDVRVEDWKIKTGSIVRFIDDKTFETSSGSIYEIVV